MKLEPIYHIGKASLTTEIVDGIREALDARELIKIGVLKNCADDPREIAQVVSDRHGTRDALNRRVNELFAENNIDIAFNQLDIFIKNKDTGEEIPFIDVAKLAQNH